MTGIYNQSKRMKQKRAVLDGIAASCGGSSASLPRRPLVKISGSQPNRPSESPASLSGPGQRIAGRAFSFESR